MTKIKAAKLALTQAFSMRFWVDVDEQSPNPASTRAMPFQRMGNQPDVKGKAPARWTCRGVRDETGVSRPPPRG